MLDSYEKESQILDALLKLPQAAHLNPERLKRFVETRKDDPRALWHVNRLSGIGGSEIGALVSALRGEQDPFGRTPETLICEKLLVFPPKKTSLAMRKGIVAEACIREFFLEDYKATRDMETIALFESADVSTPYPWMRYSPDDVVFIGNRRYLVDYKNPSEATLHENVLTGYVCQLHQGKMILDYNSVRIDGMLLVQFPHTGDDLVVSEITMDDSIADDIVTAGNSMWGEVLAGRIPPYDWNIDLPHALTEGEQEKLLVLSGEFSRAKAMVDALTDDMEVIKVSIADVVTPKALPAGTKLVLSGMNVGVSAKFNADVAAQAIGDDAIEKARMPVYSPGAMVEYLNKKHVDMSQFESGEFVWNEAELRKLMDERGLKENQFTSSKLRMTQSTTKEYKEAARMAVTGVRDSFPVVEKTDPSRKTKPKLKS